MAASGSSAWRGRWWASSPSYAPRGAPLRSGDGPAPARRPRWRRLSRRRPRPGRGRGPCRSRGPWRRVVYVTNNSMHYRADYQTRLAAMGAPVSPDTVVSSARATAAYLRDHDPEIQRVLVLGAGGLERELRDQGYDVVTAAAAATRMSQESIDGFAAAGAPDAVVVGLDPNLTYARLAVANDSIRAGAHFIATNRDPVYPTERGLRPGAGSLVIALEYATGVVPVSIGKPAPYLLEAAAHAVGREPSRGGDDRRRDRDGPRGRAGGRRALRDDADRRDDPGRGRGTARPTSSRLRSPPTPPNWPRSWSASPRPERGADQPAGEFSSTPMTTRSSSPCSRSCARGSAPRTGPAGGRSPVRARVEHRRARLVAPDEVRPGHDVLERRREMVWSGVLAPAGSSSDDPDPVVLEQDHVIARRGGHAVERRPSLGLQSGLEQAREDVAATDRRSAGSPGHTPRRTEPLQDGRARGVLGHVVAEIRCTCISRTCSRCRAARPRSSGPCPGASRRGRSRGSTTGAGRG